VSVTEGLMQVGTWTLKMKPGTSIEIRREFDWFANVIITASRIYDPALTFEAAVEASKYTGIVLKRNVGEGRFGGLGMLGYLQTGRGHSGDYGSPSGLTFPADFGDVVAAFITGDEASNGLVAGTGFSTTAVQVQSQDGPSWPPTKPILDELATQTGNEYVARPDGTVDYGDPESLFEFTPTVLISPVLRGRDDVNALEVTSWSVGQDLLNFRDRVIALSDDGLYANDSPTSGSPLGPFWGWDQNDYLRYWDRITVNSDDTGDVDDAAVAASAEFADVNYSITCSVAEYCIPRLITPGDWVYVHDRDNDLVGGAEVMHFGRSIFAPTVRCTGYTWPIQAGMGVYVVNNQTRAVTDVSDFVEWETGDTRLELGSPPPRIMPMTVSKFR
jgi:hypothetical protein